MIDEILAAAVAGAPSTSSALDEAAVRARCDSPRFRRGLLVPDDATVHPARLALGLRRRLLERGRRDPRALARARAARHAGRVVAETGAARVRAGAAVLAVNAATRGVRPLRSRLSVTSSHIVLTEPVPDVLEQIGWTGGESITDGRMFVHYFRTTHDGRIAVRLGRRAARVRRAARGRVEVDPTSPRRSAAHLVDCSRRWRAGAITHAWGGPIDVSPSHLPQIGTLDDGPVHYAFGFTGNGVGPSHLAGRVLAALALGEGDRTLALVDPGAAACRPSRWPGSAGWSCAARSCAPSGSRPTAAGRTRSRARSARRRGRSGSTCRDEGPANLRRRQPVVARASSRSASGLRHRQADANHGAVGT